MSKLKQLLMYQFAEQINRLVLPGEQVRVGVLAVLVLAEVLGRPEVLGQGDPRLLDDPPELDGVEGGAAARREVRDLHQLQGEALVLRVKNRCHLGEEDSITRMWGICI